MKDRVLCFSAACAGRIKIQTQVAHFFLMPLQPLNYIKSHYISFLLWTSRGQQSVKYYKIITLQTKYFIYFVIEYLTEIGLLNSGMCVC